MKVELRCYNKYYDIEDDDGVEYLLTEMYDANSDSIDYEIMVDGENLDDAKMRVELISALLSYRASIKE